MRESPKAAQAWNDYLAMGAEHSLDVLLERYLNATLPVPTRRIATLKRWSVIHGWQVRLLAIAEQERAAIIAKGIAERQNRVNALNDRWERLGRVITERAADPAMESVPGGMTGALVHQRKMLGQGPHAQIIDEYQVDTGLFAELRATEKQAAQELGQWIEKGELTGKNGGPLDVRVEDARNELAARLAAIAERRRAARADRQPEAGARDEASV